MRRFAAPSDDSIFSRPRFARPAMGAEFVRGAICPTCDGTGTVSRARTIEVSIPAGVTSGQRIRVKGQGSPSASGGPAGDVFLIVNVLPDSRFERDGANLKTTIDVPLLDAVLGGEAARAHAERPGRADHPGRDAKRPSLPPAGPGHAQTQDTRVNAGDSARDRPRHPAPASERAGTGALPAASRLHGGR